VILYSTDPIAADLEAEDIDFGNAINADLALDVDGFLDEAEDPEALESDDEDQLNEELGLDDNSQSVCQFFSFLFFVASFDESLSAYAYCSPLFYAAK